MNYLSILVVDDEPNARMGIAFTIEQWSKGQCEIEVLENGKRALDLLQKRSFDLLITDISMPVMSGIELVEELRKEGNKIECIFLTGFAEFEYAKKGLKYGVFDYLLKPIQQEVLIETIEKVFEKINQKKTARIK